VAADFDRDRDVDQSDFGHLQKCLTGTGPVGPGCENADLDEDGCVNNSDLLRLYQCFSGPGALPDPACEQP